MPSRRANDVDSDPVPWWWRAMLFLGKEHIFASGVSFVIVTSMQTFDARTGPGFGWIYTLLLIIGGSIVAHAGGRKVWRLHSIIIACQA